MWLFRHKYHAGGTLSRYKARLVTNGSTQIKGVDVDETFSLVVKPDTIQTVLSFATFYMGTDTAYLLLYVDDIVLTASSETLQQQKKYVVEILERADMLNCNPCRTPVDTESKLGDSVHQVGLHMHDPRKPYFSALKRILRRSTSGYYVFLGNNVLFWSSKRQPTLFRSSAEAEYCDATNAVAETC
uniref:Uncharacterized protein n=1 Tax=Tanacetum cinerariifolium TaxID=118510 RepID=A0A699HQP5_TANCI|nr:hypothetical protein [Tanacetum cinerariifolium]